MLIVAAALALRLLYLLSIPHAYFFDHLQTDALRYIWLRRRLRSAVALHQRALSIDHGSIVAVAGRARAGSFVEPTPRPGPMHPAHPAN